jgi:hypothetical protein
VLGGEDGDARGALKAEEFASFGAGFGYAVGDQGEFAFGVEADGGFDVFGLGAFYREFFAALVRGEVTGVGYGCGPVGVEAEDEAGSPDGAVKRGLLHLAGKPLGVPVGDYWVK